jgi:integrase
MASGCVTVQVIKDRLRLLWSWQGRRFFLYIGLPETKPNRKAANIKPQTIELDMTSNNFDPSLASYKPQAQSEAISVVEMFDRFTQQKQRTISIGPLAKYLSLQQHVLVFFKGKTSVSVSFIYCRKVSSLFGAEA